MHRRLQILANGPLIACTLMMSGCSIGSGTSASPIDKPGGSYGERPAYLMAYFRSGPNQTDMSRRLHYAFSRDGLHWYELNGNKAVWETPVGGKIIRDPFMNKGPDGYYHLVHTMQSSDPLQKGKQIGYAKTKDLIQFTDARPLTVMGNFPGTVNSWAPEWNWDEAGGRYMVHWSSTLNSEKADNNRIYKAYTKDWRTFTPAESMFDPGYSIIDSNITLHNGTYFLFFKDESMRPMRNRLALSKSLGGNYGSISEQLTPSVTEGAEVLKLTGRDKWYLYYDFWAGGRYGVMESTDMLHWSQELPQEATRFPYQRRHGCFFPISEDELARLIRHYSTIAHRSGMRFGGAKADVQPAAESTSMREELLEPFELRTVSMWLNANRLQGTQVLYDEGEKDTGVEIKLEGDTLIAAIANEGQRVQASAKLPAASQWTHIAAVFAEGSLKLYVDGELKHSSIAAFKKVAAREAAAMIGGGKAGDGNYFAGRLDDVSIYNTPLLAEDVHYEYLRRTRNE